LLVTHGDITVKKKQERCMDHLR